MAKQRGGRYDTVAIDGQTVQVLREERSLTQEQLAAAIDRSRGYISVIESGRQPRVSRATADGLALALSVDVARLLSPADESDLASSPRSPQTGAVRHLLLSSVGGTDPTAGTPGRPSPPGAAASEEPPGAEGSGTIGQRIDDLIAVARLSAAEETLVGERLLTITAEILGLAKAMRQPSSTRRE